MSNVIAIIVFLGSLLGIFVILFPKIPLVKKLPLQARGSQENLALRLKNKIKDLGPLKSFSSESLLHKLLSKTRILTLKMESKISGWQHQLRKNSKKEKEIENDTYWKELKNSTNQKGKNRPA
ncbi:hypothetical protein IH779_03630 [Patescibacteria group bacterium]|nr:hypothetical protein [Patescibacteria group bacterium]